MPVCQTGYIMSFNLHARCESCLGLECLDEAIDFFDKQGPESDDSTPAAQDEPDEPEV